MMGYPVFSKIWYSKKYFTIFTFYSSGKLHVAVLIEQMKLLKQIGDLDNYWKCCELLLSRHCIVFKNYEELRMALTSSNKEKWTKIAKLRIVKGSDDLESRLSSVLNWSCVICRFNFCDFRRFWTFSWRRVQTLLGHSTICLRV